MQVCRWGNSLAVRLPVELVRELGLEEGDQVRLRAEDGTLAVRRVPRSEEILEDLRRFRGRLQPGERLTRDEANER